MRVLLNTTRRLCREEEDIMADFGGVKAVIDSDPRGQIDEDDYMSTKSRLLTLGGKLTDNRRKQQRLASQVEELQGATKELVDSNQLTELDGYEFDMESFKRESSALPEMPKLATTLPSYDLFNHAPYSPDPSRPGSAMSMESDRPGSALERVRERSLHRKVTLSVAVDSTDEEEVASDAYLPQKHGLKKKKDLARNKRAPSETSETSDGEEVYQVFTNTNRMTPMEAKQKAEEDRKKAAEEEAKLQKRIDEQLKREQEEENKQKEALEKKKKEEDEKKKNILESKQKAAGEKAAQMEAKKKEAEEKKNLEINTQAQARQKEEQEKKKSANEAKKKKEAEEKQQKEEAEAKKKTQLEAQKKEKEEAEAKKKADLELYYR